MSVALIKTVNGKAANSNEFTSWVVMRCPRCEQTYRLGYSKEEWRKLRTWQALAQQVLCKAHDLRHKAATIVLEWRGIGIRKR